MEKLYNFNGNFYKNRNNDQKREKIFICLKCDKLRHNTHKCFLNIIK